MRSSASNGRPKPMVDKRGGYQKPSKPATTSGVGRNSKRTDGQPVRSPNVQDSTDLTQGDRRTIEQGQKVQPLSTSSTPRLAGPSTEAPPLSGGEPAQLPPHIFELPTTRPGEPLTEGSIMGPGGGPEVLQSNQVPDDKVLALQWLARAGNSDAAQRIQAGVLDSQRPPDPSAMPIQAPLEMGE
jgi:hypothetical protein